MKASEVIRAAHAIIMEGWSQGANARDSQGGDVPLFAGLDRAAINPLAASFSIYGALCKAASGQRQEESALMWERLAIAAKARSGIPGGTNHLHPLLGFNEMEGQTKQAVLDLLTYVADSLDPPPALIALPAPESEGAGA